MNTRLWVGFSALGATAVFVMAASAHAQPPAAQGQTIFESRCKMCHDPAIDRAPGREQLGYMQQSQIVEALTNGVMQPMAAGLSDADKRAVAEFLAPGGGQVVRNAGPAPAAPAAAGRAPPRAPVVTTDTLCTTSPPPIVPGKSDWIGAGGALNTPRYQPNPGFKAGDAPRLKLKWAMSISPGNGQPTVVGDWMWVGSNTGNLYALDPKTGCVRWHVTGVTSRTTPMPVKSSISPSGWALVVGQRSKVVKAVDAATGKDIWASEVLDTHRASGLTGSPMVAGDIVFQPVSSGEEASSGAANYACCSFRGSLQALDLRTGKVLWKTYAITEPMKLIRKNAAGTQLQGPAGGAIWSQPTADLKRGLVYIATGDSYTDADTVGTDAIMALDMKTGAVRWQRQVTKNDNFIMNCSADRPAGNCPTPLGPDYDFGASPILLTLKGGRQVLLAGQKSGIAYGFDPDTGKMLWNTQVASGSALGGLEWGIAADDKRLFAAGSDIVLLFGEQAAPGIVNPNPNARARPGLTAIDALSGKVLWHVETPKNECAYKNARYKTCISGQSAAPAAMPGVVFSGSTDGIFRAYDSATGKILWRYDTDAQTYDTVNGVKGQPGGGLDGNGPTIANGMVFTSSGFDGAANYGSTGFGSNVLLAFSIDGK